MQLDKVTIAGFRSYVRAFDIELAASATTIVGRNDAGKSSILEALEAFFAGKVDPRDFSVGSDSSISITCEFSDLPQSVSIDSNFSTTFSEQHLLTRDRSLRVTKEWTRTKLSAPAVSVHACHPTSSSTSLNLLDLKQQALKKVATDRGITIEVVREEGDARTNAAYRKAIWSQVLESADETLVERKVDLSREDGLGVAKALENYYPHFHLFRSDRASDESEPIAQDPIKLIVKEVLEANSEALDDFAQQIEKQVSAKLIAVVDKLAEVAPDMAATLRPRDLAPKWQGAYGKAQFIDENDVPLSRRGSGTRRLVLLSFFRAEAERDFSEDQGTYHRGVITAVEEPETSLHSDLQKHILTSLLDVAEQPGKQVLLTTHSSNLLREVPATSIRYIQNHGGDKTCITAESEASGRDLLDALNKSLGVFSDHSVSCFVLLEGRRDKESLIALTQAIHDKHPEKLAPFADLEARGRIAFMPVGGGGNLSLWESNLTEFKRHELYMVDSDRDEASARLKPEVVKLQARATGDRTVVVLERRELENYLTFDGICSEYSKLDTFREKFGDRLTAEGPWEYIDVPRVVAEVAHLANADVSTLWSDLSEEKRAFKESSTKKRLSSAFSHPTVVAEIWESDSDLKRAILKIDSLARSHG